MVHGLHGEVKLNISSNFFNCGTHFLYKPMILAAQKPIAGGKTHLLFIVINRYLESQCHIFGNDLLW